MARPHRTLLALVAVVAAACGGTVDEPAAAGGPTDAAGRGSEVAWEHLAAVEGQLPDRAAAAVTESQGDTDDAWRTHGFEGDAPTLGDDEVLLLLGRFDNSCPDTPISLAVLDGALDVEWLAPPGGCTDEGLLWLHALRVHRGVLGGTFSYGLERPFEDELRPVTIELPPFDGDAPPAPAPPQAMDDAALDEVFAGHPVERCGPEHDPIAAIFGDPDREVTDEFDPEDARVSEDIEAAVDVLVAAGEDPDRTFSPLFDRSQGAPRAAVIVHEPRVPEIQALLDDELGAGTVHVWADPWDPIEVTAAWEDLMELMGPASEGPGAITGVSGPPGPMEIGMVDPTREALDRIAASVDPALVCVDVELSGVRPEPLDD
jgi:hypothetical protein